MSRSNAFPLEASWLPMLRDLGVVPRAVLRRAELPEDLFRREGPVGLPTDDYFRLWTALEREVGEPELALHLGQVVRSEIFHPVLFAAMCSTNMSVAAQRIAAYKRLVAPMELHVLEDDERLVMEFEWLERTVEPPVSLALFELVFQIAFARMATREPIYALRVETPRLPAKLDPYTEFFGVRIEQSERHAVHFSRADGRRPFLTANESMWKMFEPSLRQRLSEIEAEATVRDRVRAALLEALPAGESSMDQIASKLGVSKRTLQRHLRGEGTSFQAVLNATREELARYYLVKTKLSGAEISYLLGFADPNSFFRAFHAWTGSTTEQVRLGGDGGQTARA